MAQQLDKKDLLEQKINQLIDSSTAEEAVQNFRLFY